MGVKELWSILTPHAERKPICELRGKKVAIDLAGWVCESLNVVDYFVHPRHHLKNLFFRTCYLIWEQVTPVFVLEGVAPSLKSEVISKRNELQFRGVRPKDKTALVQSQLADKGPKGRTRFNHVLKQCENLLLSMGIQCVQGPGEAEAYCAFLNKHGLVDGVISQDSDCFAYGALRVYRNFSVSTQGTQAAAGGAVDIYDMEDIRNRIDFGQHKVIVMALLCGCDYCPDGVGGIGKDSVLKLFKVYKESEILEKLRKWRHETETYNSLELRVDDKNICTSCGHIGRTQSHSKNGCFVCQTHHGCDGSLWKEKRLSIKAELALRKKALENEKFPNEEIISEFLSEPACVPNLNLDWKQPNLVKFIKQVGKLLQWPEIYCFQKFFPIVTRWQLLHSNDNLVEPYKIIKKRTVKGVASLKLQWQDTRGCFNGLIPHDQISKFEKDNPKGLNELYSTIEPLDLLYNAYPSMVDAFIKLNEKVPKAKKANKLDAPLNSLNNSSNISAPTKTELKHKRGKKKVDINAQTNQRTMLQFLRQNDNTPLTESVRPLVKQCSTPINRCLSSDLESDCELDMSDIINGIVSNPHSLPVVTNYEGHLLQYNTLTDNLSLRLAQLNLGNDNILHGPHKEKLKDDSDLLLKTRREFLLNIEEGSTQIKSYSLDDSFDLLVKGGLKKNMTNSAKTPLERFKHTHHILTATKEKLQKLEIEDSPEISETNVSYFFNSSFAGRDVFEQLMESSMVYSQNVLVISDSD